MFLQREKFSEKKKMFDEKSGRFLLFLEKDIYRSKEHALKEKISK
jgi:hypothetical protein